MIFPNRFPNQMHPPRRPFNPSLFSGRTFNRHIQPTPFGFQPQNQLTSLTSKGVGGLSNILTNVQQVLKVVESTAPIVQQYGPMIKNLPAMYRMMKAFKEIDDEESAEQQQEPIHSKDTKTTKNNLSHDSNIDIETDEEPYLNQPKPTLFI